MRFHESTFEPETSPGYLVRLINQMSVAAVDRMLTPDGLTATQWMTLVALHFGHADTCAGLARTMAHDTGAMTRLLDQLETNKWVERQRDAGDRRVIRVSLTPTGLEVALAAKRKVIACWNGMLSDWSEQEVADLLATLQRLRRTMEASDACAA